MKISRRFVASSNADRVAAVDEPTGDYYLFTKDRENSVSEVYRYPFPQSADLNPFTLGTRVL